MDLLRFIFAVIITSYFMFNGLCWMFGVQHKTDKEAL